MKLEGETVNEGLKSWIISELKTAPSREYDLGKFFFTVSTGTIGAIVAIERLNQNSKVDLPNWYSIFPFILFNNLLSFNGFAQRNRNNRGHH